MKHAVWIVLAWTSTLVATAFASEFRMAYLLPELVVIVAVFLAFQREAVPLVASCLLIGYVVGRQSLAPLGLHEIALATTALGIHLVIGNITAGGRGFFAATAGVATAIYHVLVFGLLLAFRGDAAFPTWTVAILLPNGVLTMVCAWVVHPWLLALEGKIFPQQRESLSF